MKIDFHNYRSTTSEILESSEKNIDYEFSHSVKCDINIYLMGIDFIRENISLIEFYLDLKQSMADTLIRNVSSAFRDGYEEFLLVEPHQDGCKISDIRPPYPVENLYFAEEVLSVEDVRHIFSRIEGEIRSNLIGHRIQIFDRFDQNQSPVLFQIIKAIDNSYVVRR